MPLSSEVLVAFNIARLEKATFRGVQFFLESSSRSAGRKVIVREYPNKQIRTTEDLGLFEATFTLVGIISGSRYFQQRDALITALDTPGNGKLIHPYYGEITVAADVYTLDEDLTEAGIARFGMVFHKTTDLTFPTEAVNNISQINQLSRDTLALAESASAELFVITDGFLSVLTDGQETLTNFALAFDAITRPFDALSEGLSEFSISLLRFQQNIFAFLNAPANLFNAIDALFDGFSNLSDNAAIRFDSISNLFGFATGYEELAPTTAQRIEARSNRQIIQSNVAYNVLARAYQDASLIEYTTEIQIEEIREILEDQYVFTRDNDNLSSEALDKLKDLRVQFTLFLDNELLNASQIITIETATTTLTALTYQYYGDLDNDLIINDLNSFINPSTISGTVEILSR